jgi:hypothetical protein
LFDLVNENKATPISFPFGGGTGFVEIRLNTAHSNADAGIVVDEYGALWKYSWLKGAHGTFMATTKGLEGETIRGVYENGTLVILTFSDARKYFSAVNPETDRDLHHM